MSQKAINNFYTCQGPNSSYVKLISNDGHEFIIPRRLIINSPTILDMLSGPGKVSSKEANAVYLHEFPSHVLQEVCRYLAFKVRYSNNNSESIPEFEISTKVVFDLIICADFLKC